MAFPVHPRFGRMLLEAEHFGCIREACAMAAKASERPRSPASSASDAAGDARICDRSADSSFPSPRMTKPAFGKRSWILASAR